MTQMPVCVMRAVIRLPAVRRSMDLPRRSLLRVGGGASIGLLAGCTGSTGAPADPTIVTDGGSPDGSSGESPDGSPDDPTDEGTGDGAGPAASVVAVDDPPALPVRPAVEVIEAAATLSCPPTVRATVTNRSDGTVTVGEGRAIVFAYVSDATDELVLLPADTNRGYPVEAGCWRLAEPIFVTEEYRTVILDPGGSVSRRVGVYGKPDGDGCLPVGEFRFETQYDVAPGANTVPDADRDGRGATWGFSLALE